MTVTAAQTLTSIIVGPTSASVPTGGTQQFSATALDQNSQPMNPQPSFTGRSRRRLHQFAGPVQRRIDCRRSVTVTAPSGGVNGTASVTVTAVPDFSLSVSPSSQTAKRGTTPTYVVTITPANGFNGAVTLSLSGQPSGVTVAFSSNPATGSSTLSLALAPNGSRGTFTLTITGTSGNLTHQATATLTVTKK